VCDDTAIPGTPAGLIGKAYLFGSAVYVGRAHGRMGGWGGFALPLGLTHVVGHELTHLLLEEWRHPFDDGEHLHDPNENHVPDEPFPGDEQYLMFPVVTPNNFGTVLFSNPTRRHLNLRSKQSVERKP
jgi:hypothetical protein